MVVFENEDVIVLNKLCNVSAQGGKRTKANVPHLMNTWLYSRNQGVEAKSAAYIVHRLDKGTSGVMLVAKHLEAARSIVKQFSAHEITKIYFAVCVGIPTAAANAKEFRFSGRIATNLEWNASELKNEVISGELSAQMAETFFDVVGVGKIDARGFRYIGGEELEALKLAWKTGRLEDSPDTEYISFVKFQIVSGKKHQIRAHAAQVLRTPLLFDTKYGFHAEDSFRSEAFKSLLFGPQFRERWSAVATETAGRRRLLGRIYESSMHPNNFLCLHAYKAVLRLPGATAPSEIRARLGLQLRTVLAVLRVPENQLYGDLDRPVDGAQTA